MKTLHIFISSPGDVAEEREKARQVIEQLQGVYGADLALKPIFWEDLPLGADASFQEGIDLLLSERYSVEIAIFIIWSRLGSPLGPPRRPDGTAYRSGTEREFAFMLEARQQSGGKRPHILAYARHDEHGFTETLGARKSDLDLRDLIDQRDLARTFIREVFHDEDGRNIRAYHTYEKPVTFAARLRTHLRIFLEEAYDMAAAGPARWEQSPYRGLQAFDLEHAPIYFGREHEVCEVELLLRRRAKAGRAAVIIVGASGAGKSSLARAGVAHSLTRENLDDAVKVWRFAVLRPTTPHHGLFRALVRALTEAAALPELGAGSVRAREAFENLLATDPNAALALQLDDAFRRAAERERGEVKLLLLVDQLEELWLDQTITPKTREAFLRALEALATSGNVWVLATLRADLYPLAQQSDGFVRLKRPAHDGDDCDGIFDLGPPTPASIYRLITEPARKARLRFEKHDKPARSLDQDLLRDTVNHADALPLLEYTLEELFKQRTADGTLTFAAYDAMGGVEGALGKNAGQTFLALPAVARDALEDILPLLVSVDAAHAQHTVRRQARLADLTATEGTRLLTGALIEARFLTTDKLDGVPIAALAHEALLRRWDHLHQWVTKNRELLQLREAVSAAASDWRREKIKDPTGAHDLLLAAGLPLSRGQRALEARVLDEADAEFVRASLTRERAAQSAKRRRLQGVALISTAAAVILACTAWLANNKTREVKKMLAESDAEHAERLFAADDSAGAVWFLCRAVASGALPPRATERLWFSLTQRSWPLPVIAPVTQPAEITAVTFDASGDRFATAMRDGTVALFTSADGKPIGQPLPHPKTVRGVQFSPDGTKLLTACDDAVARLWDVRKPVAALLGLSRHEDVVAGIAWSPDGRRYATGSWDKRVCVWNPARPEAPVFTAEMTDKVHTVAFDPKNPARVLGVAKDEVDVWDLGSSTPLLHYQGVEDLGGASFSTEGSKVLSFGNDGDVVISEVAGGLQWAQLALGTSCRQAVFSSDGKVFAVAFGTHVRAYTVQQPPEMLWEHSFPGLVTRLKFTTEGKRLLTACDDGKIQLFDADGGRSLSEPIAEAGVPVGLDFHPSGNRVLTARSARTACVWSLSPPTPLPVAEFGQGSPPLLLHLDHEVKCVAENGKGLAFALPSTPDQDVPVRRMDFAASLVAAAFDPMGGMVAGSSDGRVLTLVGERVEVIGKLAAPVAQLAFSADGTSLAAGDDEGGLACWRRPGFNAVRTAWKHADRIGGLALLTPGPMLLSASWDHCIALTNASTTGNGQTRQWPINGEPQAVATDPASRVALVALNTGEVWRVTAQPPDARTTFRVGNPPSAAALHPDGNTAAVGTVAGTVNVWDTRGGRKIAEFSVADARVNSLCFGVDGRWLAVGTEDGRARVYESATGQPVSEEIVHAAAVRHVLITPDGRSLLTATRDGAVFVWPLAQPDDLARAAGIARRVMREETAGPPFAPRMGLVPVPDAARLRRLRENLRHEDATAAEVDLLSSYLGP